MSPRGQREAVERLGWMDEWVGVGGAKGSAQAGPAHPCPLVKTTVTHLDAPTRLAWPLASLSAAGRGGRAGDTSEPREGGRGGQAARLQGVHASARGVEVVHEVHGHAPLRNVRNVEKRLVTAAQETSSNVIFRNR